MNSRDTPPYSGPTTPDIISPDSSPCGECGEVVSIATPTSITSTPRLTSLLVPTVHIPKDLTQAQVSANPQLKRCQQDLLILTSFNENESLHWRPSWFAQELNSKHFWTLHNPPNVVTERMPYSGKGRAYFTRRLRTAGDAGPYFIKSWAHWAEYCTMYGVPSDFLCEVQIELLRLGLLRDATKAPCAPPFQPLYPEPQPPGQGRYILDTATYGTHLPLKFKQVSHAGIDVDEVDVVVVHSNGALKIEPREPFFMHASQWTHFDGRGGYRLDDPQIFDDAAPKEQGPGRRWSYLPWTSEQEESCRTQLVVRLPVGGKGRAKGSRLLKKLKSRES